MKDSEKEFSSGWLRGLNRNVITLGIISFLGDIASEMLYPIMPLFIQGFLGVPVSGLGVIEGLAEATSSFLKVFSGQWTDHTRKRKPWIFTGYLLSAVSRSLIGAASGWGLVTLGRLSDRVGKGLRTTPRDALLGDSVSPRFRGKAFGWHRGMDTLGAAVGPLLSLALLKVFSDNMRWIFFAAVVPGLLSAATVFWIREVPPKDPRPVSRRWHLKELPRPFWQFISVLCLFNLANSSDLFIFLKYKHLEISTTAMILTYCGFNLVYALSSPLLGAWADRFGKGLVFQGGLVCFSLVYGLFTLSSTWVGMAAGFLLYGIYMAATEGISRALAIDLVPGRLKGTALGVVGLTIGLSTMISSSVVGVLWDHLSPQTPFWLGTIGGVLAIILFRSLKINESRFDGDPVLPVHLGPPQE